MRADSLRISKVFNSGGDVHYILPYFQREYAWEKSNWQTLLNDVLSVYDSYSADNEPEHFMGSLVVINDGTRSGTMPAFKLVDGQQRLITISLFFCALGRLAEKIKPNLKVKIQKLLVNPEEDGLLHYKLLPTAKYGDRDIYLALINGDEVLPHNDSKIPEAFNFLHNELESRLATGDLDIEKLFIVLNNCLQVVFIDLNQEEQPYKIFESLNHKGKTLSQADLVRNYIAMKLPEPRQAEIFEKHWAKVENLLQEKRTVGRSGLGELTAFLRHYLAFRTGILIKEGYVYERFRDRVEKEFKTNAAFEQEIATLKRFGEYYDKLLRPEHETNKNIRESLTRLNTLEISTAYPFLLAVYEAVTQGNISQSEFIEGLQILENYIVRRYLVREPTNYTNKMFPMLWKDLWKDVDEKDFVNSLRKSLVTKNYPADHRIRQAILSEHLYEKRSESRSKLILVFDIINRHLSDMERSGGYTSLNAEPTIEHLMPQTLDDGWKNELGKSWEQTHGDYLDTLGNLTLVTQEWNSSLSNSIFSIKKRKLENHALKINSDYFCKPIANWDENAIRERAEWLAGYILEIWSSLGTPPNVSVKPTKLIVLGKPHTVVSWRDVAYYTVINVAEWVDDFDKIAEQYPAYFDKSQFKGACRQLPNGWWLYLNLSAASVKGFCRNLLASADIPEDEWQVEEVA